MMWPLAFMAAIGTYLLAVPRRRDSLAVSLEPYLTAHVEPEVEVRWSMSVPTDGLAAAAVGVVLGLLVAQGDFLIAGQSRSSGAMAILGAGAGWVLWSMRRTNLRERRARRLRFELPVIADALSLHVVAGESISSAIRSVSEETNGVAADELLAIVKALDEGDGVPEALRAASLTTVVGDATRLYETLSHAHTTGGRLAVALGDLAVDYRATLARDLTTESGKRAIVTYGPVLALMVPTALIFLLYPTLLGLRALSGAP
ncbi:MAG: type II secretion system F family protein [Actinomycetota bacterium]